MRRWRSLALFLILASCGPEPAFTHERGEPREDRQGGGTYGDDGGYDSDGGYRSTGGYKGDGGYDGETRRIREAVAKAKAAAEAERTQKASKPTPVKPEVKKQ
jgi:hypothetical protein